MRVQLTLFGSRVARRVFVLFVLAGMLPLAAAFVLVSLQVGGTLESRSFADLDDISRASGHRLLDRLLLARQLLSALPVSSTSVASIAFDAVFIQGPDGTRQLLGEPAAAPSAAAIPSGRESAVTVAPGPGGRDVYLSEETSRGRLVGRLDRAFLEQAVSQLPDSLRICVYARSSGTELLCSGLSREAGQGAAVHDALARAAAAQDEVSGEAGSGSSGRLRWAAGGRQWLASYWELFVASQFAGESWLIVASEPRSVAVASLTALNRIVPQALALSSILVMLLSIAQIRRTLGPLNLLVAGTTRIAKRHFGARVRVESNDEFGDLARAMNTMAEDLGRQFGTLTVLAEVDRLILSSRGIEEVLEAVLVRVSAILPQGELGVLLIDREQPSKARVYTMPSPGEGLVLERIGIGQDQHRRLALQPDGVSLARGDFVSLFSRAGAPRAEMDQLFAVPILHGRDLRGALLAGLASPPNAEDRRALREIASRFAVAIAAVERELALFERAHFDALTGLPNRRLCYDRLSQALARARSERERLAVLFIDLDGFKNVNDSLGHSVGDELLKEIASRLREAVRDVATVARLGGDEYVVILPGVQGALEVEGVAREILAALGRPVTVGGREAFVTASIGATLFPDDGDSTEELLRKADTAMYGAKDQGRARCVFFAAAMDRRVHERLALETDLRYALENGELFVAYQPQLELRTHRVVCVEALLRWRHPERGLVSPATFIPVLEEAGMIESVGAWVLQTAAADFARWRKDGLPVERLAVNVSANQLFEPQFASQVLECLRGAGVEAGCLEIELTESVFVRDFESSNSVLRALREEGVHIAVDDFGTGYSSFAYLRDLVFDTVKIDRTFVDGIPDKEPTAIVRAIIAVAKALDKQVVAEGVESPEQWAMLSRLGCDLGQGFLFSPPLAAAQLAARLAGAEGASAAAAPAAAGGRRGEARAARRGRAARVSMGS